MRGRVVGSVGAGVSGLGRGRGSPMGTAGSTFRDYFLSPPKRPLIALPARLTVSAALPPSAVPSSVSLSGGSGTLIAAALRPTLTVPV